MKELLLLIRFDDLCPTMNHTVWMQVENICNKYNIKPILAVIPDNQDSLFAHSYDENFWQHMKALQKLGWTIGLHGLHHTFCSSNSGKMKITSHSEFVPKSYAEQVEIIAEGKRIFAEKGLKIDLFIAPCHSFDENTLLALRKNGISIISDGFYNRPVRDKDGIVYIPSRLWERSRIPQKGFYTICCHAEFWKEDDLSHFEELIKKYQKNIIAVSDIEKVDDITIFDNVVNAYRIAKINLKNLIKKILRVGVKK